MDESPYRKLKNFQIKWSTVNFAKMHLHSFIRGHKNLNTISVKVLKIMLGKNW